MTTVLSTASSAAATTGAPLNHPGHTHTLLEETTTSPAPSGAFWATEEFWVDQYEYLSVTAVNVVQRLIFALILGLVGWIIIKIVLWVIGKVMNRSGSRIDHAVRTFILSVIKAFLYLILVMMVMGVLGIEMVSAGALIAALAFGVGMAISNFAGNLIGGIVILAYKHIVVGDFIKCKDVTGTIKAIHMTTTIVNTPDNKQHVVPNLSLAAGIVTNYSKMPERRVDMVFGVGYDADLKMTRRVFKSVCQRHPLVLSEPELRIEVESLGDSSVNFLVRPWVKTSDYWHVFWDVTEAAKLALDKHHINIPYPQLDAHIFRAAAHDENDNAASDDEDDDDSLFTDSSETTHLSDFHSIHGESSESDTVGLSIEEVKKQQKGIAAEAESGGSYGDDDD